MLMVNICINYSICKSAVICCRLHLFISFANSLLLLLLKRTIELLHIISVVKLWKSKFLYQYIIFMSHFMLVTINYFIQLHSLG